MPVAPELYLAFVAATALLILAPGPAVSLIVANALVHGGPRALITVAGTSSAIALQLLVVALGVTSLMTTLAEWFAWLRWLGVAYLVWLGVRAWRAPATALEGGAAASARRLYWQGVVVNGTNPKTLFFLAALFPQFVDPAAPPGPQMALLCPTFLAIATLIDGGWALAAGRLRALLAGGRRARLRNRLSGALLIGAGLGLALARAR